LSGAGLRLGKIVVLTVPGRTTGKPRSTPVAPLVVDGHRYVVAGIPGSDWARNVRAAWRGELSSGRHREQATFTEVTDRAICEQVMRAFPREVPGGVAMFVQTGVVASPDPDDFAAAAGAVTVFEIHPA